MSPPIDERSFTRDFSITRIQRIQWLQGQQPQLEDNSGHGHSGYGHTPGDGSSTGHPIVRRLSTTSYPNESSIDPDTGKWRPQHSWTVTHDELYARLCYSVLLFRSPRKSNYVIAHGKCWYVDWATGRMVRALPPAYDKVNVVPPPNMKVVVSSCPPLFSRPTNTRLTASTSRDSPGPLSDSVCPPCLNNVLIYPREERFRGHGS